jgi:hypothetical protein
MNNCFADVTATGWIGEYKPVSKKREVGMHAVRCGQGRSVDAECETFAGGTRCSEKFGKPDKFLMNVQGDGLQMKIWTL